MTAYTLTPATDVEHERITEARFNDLKSSGRAQRRALKIESVMDPGAEARLFNLANNASSARKKLIWLHRAASVLDRAVKEADVAACRTGCNHCCHIPVVISAPEARLLAVKTGRKMVEAPARSLALKYADVREDAAHDEIEEFRTAGAAAHNGVPCAFLVDGGCSVYDIRPLVCRYQVSLDDDDLLCRLTETGTVRVPYLDNSKRSLAATMILGPTQRIADIRDWFRDTSESAT